MSTELSNYDTLSKEQIMRLTGQEDDSSSGGNTLPRLSINKDAEDDDGNTIPSGVYTIYNPESESRVYGTKEGKTLFRPFINSYQYMEYDPEKNNYPHSSIIFKSWKDEPLDTKGTLRCGKVIGKDKDRLSDVEIELQKNIKCYRLIYGLLTMDATTAEGEPVEVKNVPVLWRVSGTSFKPVGDIIQSIKNRGKLMQNIHLRMGGKRQKNGSTVWYTPILNVEDKEIAFSKQDLQTMEMFSQLIDDENKKVVESWKKAQASAHSEKNAERVMKTVEDIDPEEAFAN
jgi:hypothetical protein